VEVAAGPPLDLPVQAAPAEAEPLPKLARQKPQSG
jgi:hypothetical protein